MKRNAFKVVAIVLALALVGAGGYWAGRDGNAILSMFSRGESAMAETAMTTDGGAPTESESKPLYWYDPMFPQHHFDKPGKSPFMDMQLVPKYADDAGGSGVKINPALAQNLGIRTATAETGNLAASVEAVASVGFNERDLAVVQARTHGFVERVYNLAPGDVVTRGAAIADILVPEWTAAQREFLALKAIGDQPLVDATRERLKLLGMPNDLIQRVERANEPHPVVTVTTPTGGVIQSLEIRTGMTVGPGMTLARVNGFSTVWLEAAVPEAQAGGLKPGAVVEARLPAFPGEVFKGKVAAVLPEANTQTRTLRVRAEFPNRQGRLKPGLFAQMRIVADTPRTALLVPSEAVIRTGKRAVVIVAGTDNRFQPVEIEIGAEAEGKTAVLKGLNPGEKIVVSGQFLIDSEASLSGVLGRMQDSGADAALHDAEGKVVKVSPDEVTLSHGPVPSMQWGSMTMPFKLAQPDLAKELKNGDNVKFAFRQQGDAFIVERLERAEAGQ